MSLARRRHRPRLRLRLRAEKRIERSIAAVEMDRIAATATATATATPTVPPQVDPVAFSETGDFVHGMRLAMSTGTAGATIFYTVSPGSPGQPTHTGPSPHFGTLVYNVPSSIPSGQLRRYKALAYKAGMSARPCSSTWWTTAAMRRTEIPRS